MFDFDFCMHSRSRLE